MPDVLLNYFILLLVCIIIYTVYSLKLTIFLLLFIFLSIYCTELITLVFVHFLIYCFLKNLFIYFYSVIIVYIFSPSLHPTPASPTSLPHLYPPPWFCPCFLYSSSYRPLSPLSPPHSPLAIVTMFLISMSLVIFCLLFSFVDYVPVTGEIILKKDKIITFKRKYWNGKSLTQL